MSTKIWILGGVSLLLASCSSQQQPSLECVVNQALERAEQQTLLMAEKYSTREGRLPRTWANNEDVSSDSRWWCSGFFPGSLWYLYENSRNPKVLAYAQLFTSRVEREKYTTDNHDVGFMLYCSFGNGLRLTADPSYEQVLLTGAKSLSTRFKPEVGLIRSWDHNTENWHYPVIIDNLMNLELLLWAAERSQNDTLRQMAISHADKTRKHHFRADFSSWHLVSYDRVSGEPHLKQTHQGFSNDSAWSRGQAWGLYGYTCLYRMTGDRAYLQQACGIAQFLLNHKHMPEDGVPYWDYDSPEIPATPRDASAAAIMASALVELSGFVEGAEATQYLGFAEKQIRTLASPDYTAAVGENGNFILKHSTGAYPFSSEVDVPLAYADYYYLEALTRIKFKLQS